MAKAAARALGDKFRYICKSLRSSCCNDPGAGFYEEQYRHRAIRNLQRKANKLGLMVVPLAAWPGRASTDFPSPSPSLPQGRASSAPFPRSSYAPATPSKTKNPLLA